MRNLAMLRLQKEKRPAGRALNIEQDDRDECLAPTLVQRISDA